MADEVLSPEGAGGEAHGRSARADDEAAESYVTFYLEGELFGLPMTAVREVVRLPELTEVPLAPPAVAGLANLRGEVLPVVNLRQALGWGGGEASRDRRVIILDGEQPACLLVDRMARILQANPEEIEQAEAVESESNPALLSGILQLEGEGGVCQLLEPQRALEAVFGDLRRAAPAAAGTTALGSAASTEGGGEASGREVVTFVAAGQELAFPLQGVEEIIRCPGDYSQIPQSGDHVIGLVSHRERLLPLVSLARLFGLPQEAVGGRVVVLALGGEGEARRVGMVVEEVREVLRLPEAAEEPVPPFLGGEGDLSELESVARLGDGDRLVSVLSLEQLFHLHGLQEALAAGEEAESAGGEAEEGDMTGADDGAEQQYLIFSLGEEEYAIAIDAVREVTRRPDELTRVPKAPNHIEGLLNLRGTVLPLVNLRRQLGLPEQASEARERILVLSVNGVETGFLVDSVTEVLKLDPGHIQTAPPLSEDQSRILGDMIQYDDRVILVVDQDELLNAGELAELQEVVAQ